MSAINNDPSNTTIETPLSWSERIKKSDKLKSRTCCKYNHLSTEDEENSVCNACGRMVRRHSFEGECSNTSENLAPRDLGYYDSNTTEVELDIWGELDSNGYKCKYLRCDYKTNMKDIYDLIVDDCDDGKPPFIISVYGGAKYFSLTDRLEKEFMRGIIHTATTANAWIVTAGTNNGVSKLVGEGISQDHVLKEHPEKLTCIGLTTWGSVGEKTRLKLRENSVKGNDHAATDSTLISHTTNQNSSVNRLEKQTLANTMEDNRNMLEENHTHCILFDNGKINYYLPDKIRSEFVTVACDDASNPRCYSVTIIVEGGPGTLDILENEIANKRPIVLIQGSGRLADVISNLLELTTNFGQNQPRDATKKEIENAYIDKFPNFPLHRLPYLVKHTAKLLKAENRCFLNVFRLDHGNINVAETIYRAIFKAIRYQKQQNSSDNTTYEYNLGLASLAIKWNYFDGGKQILELPKYTEKGEQQTMIQDIGKTKILFQEALKYNRPAFIDYFLRAGFDVRNLSSSINRKHCEKVILELYLMSLDPETESHSCGVKTVLGSSPIKSIQCLNKIITNLLGSFFHPIYFETERNPFEHIALNVHDQYLENNGMEQVNPNINILTPLNLILSPNTKKCVYSEQEMLRDLFFWSIFMDLPQMAKVLLTHLRPRICGALIASAIFKRYAEKSPSIDFKQKMLIQACDFELYAAKCVDQCYDYNDETTCQLILRQIPLFGKVTCMQVAISSSSTKFLETACFDQALNQVWCNKLDLSNRHFHEKPKIILSMLFFGLPAPFIIKYRSEDNQSGNDKNAKSTLSPRGINYYSKEKTAKYPRLSTFWKRFIYFHQSPMVRMGYHFINYIWFLMVFSYMMLYHFDLPSERLWMHWTEIYVIVTVSSMFIEELRRRAFETKNRMRETWDPARRSVLPFLNYIFYMTLYLLFYLGIAFRYSSGNNRNFLTAGRILLAFDLELWYLRSLKFVIALKFLGPKLFMLQNMLRDLFAFVYMIFIAIAAYGVVSRSLVLYKEIPFDARHILGQIFDSPYWLIFEDIRDKDMIHDFMEDSSANKTAEAIATHILLAFHMLFINILLLNLLIAVFADTIGKVQQNTEFYWRYQRYSFVRQYFEQTPIGYPPLVLFSYLGFLLYACKKIKKKYINRSEVNNINNPETIDEETTNLLSVFKFIPVDGEPLDEYWYMFESAATLSYARSRLEKKKQFSSLGGKKTLLGEISDEQRTISTNFNLSSSNVNENRSSDSDRQNIIDALRGELTTIRSTLTDVQLQLKQRDASFENLQTMIGQMTESMQRMMGTRNPVEIN